MVDTDANGEDPADRPTHAGGVVRRRIGGVLEVLLVRARGGGEWVLPKGHIEPGERTEQAALREVLEETGAVCALGAPLGMLRFRAPGEDVRCAYYALDLVAQRGSDERREVRWATLDDVHELVPFPETVALLERAAAT